MAKNLRLFVVLLLALSLIAPSANLAPSAHALATIEFTILHTNDFHGNLEPAGSNPGMARLAYVVEDIRDVEGTDNVLLLDVGDSMQGSLLSNLQKGEPTIAVFNAMGYAASTFGNHEFDWGQQTLIDRTTQADFPYVSANIVAGSCDAANWTAPSFATPYEIITVGTGANTVDVGVIGVTSTETPIITIASATAGLCFKDPAESILHYYDELDATSDVIVVLSHIGYPDGGYGYGIPVYGDQTLAKMLNDAGKPVDLILGGHSHTNLPAATIVGSTTIAQAHYAGRRVGRADLTYDTVTGDVAIAWQSLAVSLTGDMDPDIADLIATYTGDPDYQAMINEPIGWTNVPIERYYDGDSLMGTFINDAIYNDLNSDAFPENDVEIVFNNSGGLRTDLCVTGCTFPHQLTFGEMFSVLPFGNQTVVGTMTGERILELLNQAASLNKGAIQVSGIRYKFFNYSKPNVTDPTATKIYAWGAFDVCVIDPTDDSCDPLDLTREYRIATNEFLAPAGQDNFYAFKYVTDISYWGDMLDGVNNWVSTTYGTAATAFDGVLDGRITRDGDADGGSIIPLTILHHNDSHGNLAKGTYVGYTQLATLINQERSYNPDRTLVLSAGDNIQGDAMMYYFKSAPLGYAADGTVLTPAMSHHPMMAAMNEVGYDAMVIGNHEYNFGSEIFKAVLSEAEFPVLQANVAESQPYGIAAVGVETYVEKTLDGIDVAIMGIGNHRVSNYELPSNIPGLTFSDPLVKAQELSDALNPDNDVVIALTHIGFTEDPKSVEVDANVDTNMAAQVTGLDAIIGSHSHTNPATGFGPYKYLPTLVADPDGEPVIINQAYRYNNTLGEVFIGLRPLAGGGYEVVSQAGQYIQVQMTTPEDPDVKAIVDPYVTLLASYNQTELGETTTPIDALTAYTEETNGANLQADAAVAELAANDIEVDFHLSGAMSNRRVADGATPAAPVMLHVSDMFTLMPYENSLVVMEMNGPQLKAVLERAYRNYYYYKYVPGYGGYSYYTTCMLTTNSGNKITYFDGPQTAYNPNLEYVASLEVNGEMVDFNDAAKYYRVSTVNYLAAGSCNFNNSGQTLWPLSQITDDTQYYVRDAVINYITEEETVSPAIEGRLEFLDYLQLLLYFPFLGGGLP